MTKGKRPGANAPVTDVLAWMVKNKQVEASRELARMLDRLENVYSYGLEFSDPTDEVTY